LVELGYSEAEITLIQKGRRNLPELPSSTTPSRSQSPTSTALVNPRARSSSLRRQKSDASIARSERSLRIGPPAPPPPLPLPPPPTAPALSPNSAAPAAPPPTPASGGAFGEVTDKEDDAAQSDAQYAYRNPHHQSTPIQPVPVPAPAHVPVAQPTGPTPVHVLQRCPSNSGTRSPISPPRSGSSDRDRERRPKTQTPSRRQFRVINTTPPPGEEFPQPGYFEGVSRSGSPISVTPANPTRPRPEASGDTRRPSVSETPAWDPPPAVERFQPAQSMETARRDAKEEEGGDENEDFVFNGSRRKPRPSVLDILPPRLSLRKDTLGDLSSWSASLFSSIPSSSHDGFPQLRTLALPPPGRPRHTPAGPASPASRFQLLYYTRRYRSTTEERRRMTTESMNPNSHSPLPRCITNSWA
jgi:hypothetical protein